MKLNWKVIVLIVAAAIGVTWLAGKLQSCGNHNAVIESLYQEVQATHQAELARRLMNTQKLEEVQAATAAAYQIKLDQQTAAADAKVRELKWKSNEQLTKEKASAEEVKTEKKKVEDALGVMTKDRDDLITIGETREKEIADERIKLKTEHEGALKTIQDQLSTCEKARAAAGDHPTWISIGPSSNIFMRNGIVEHAFGISIQIPIITIKSPFKRF